LIAITQRLVKDFKVNIQIPGLLVVDTPGHEAFANLRTRGGSVADIAILVVDVMHGFENQTFESLNILKSRKVPFIVAANKIDRIQGWRSSENGSFLNNYRDQQDFVQSDLDNRLYNIMGTLSRQEFSSERFDRVKDFTKNIAIVPLSAKTGEGLGELLAVLIGLTQQYLGDRLEYTQGPAKGTVLEIREEVGLGTTLNAIIYDGVLNSDDTIVIGGKEGPLITKIRAILVPQPLEEIRDPRKKFDTIDEVSAAAGIKIAASDIDDAIAGGPLLAVGEDMPLEKALEEIEQELERLRIQADQTGIILKTDTLGSLEAIIVSLKSKDIPIRVADIGDVSRREVMEALSVKYEEPLYGTILAFNVKILPDAEKEASNQNVPIFWNDIIYNLMDEYVSWMEKEREAKIRKEFESLTLPGKIRVMDGFIFRRAKPAIFGVEVLRGIIESGVSMINEDGERIGHISQIQERGESINRAEEDKEVAISMPQPIVGRHVKERDILYVDLPEQDASKLRNKFIGRLTEGEEEALQELVEIKRKIDILWAV
ncbi:translation initiation factor IF-2, partial [Candidatus Bathyarchaeota archaeon]|nr:translation initiation factor IF-2 [Candidatus Bathyarchaeota archaeon]